MGAGCVRLRGRLGIDKFFYTGHSHGAGIGWHLCVNHPSACAASLPARQARIRRTARQPAGARMETINAAKSRESWEPYAKKQGAYCAKYFERVENDPVIGEEARAAREQMIQFWIDMPAVSALLNPRKPFPKCKTEEELIEVLKNIHVPTLMLGGSEDTISGPDLMVRTCGLWRIPSSSSTTAPTMSISRTGSVRNT